MRILPLSSLLLLAVAACGGGSSSAGPNAPNPNAPNPGASTAGSVHVVVDTATGADGLLQFVVAGAVLERSDGALTGNLLTAPVAVAFADASGEVAGLRLRDVPAGDYDTLHLMLLPGSGSVLFADGAVHAVAGPADLTIPIADGLLHAADRASWLAVGHNSGDCLHPTPAGLQWQPQLTGRLDGSTHELVDVRPLLVADDGLTGELPCAGAGLLHVAFAPGCVFTDEQSDEPVTLAEFRAEVLPADDLRVAGDLHRDGRFVASHVHRGRGGEGPRLIGRITQLFPANAAFVMRVQAEVHRGERRLVDPPEDVFVLTQGARLHRPNRQTFLAYGELAVGNLAKVKVLEYAQVPGLLLIVTAREIEITGSGGVPPSPEWQGRVQSVDLLTNTIVAEPRNGHGIVVNGQPVSAATVHVAPGTLLQRRERHGASVYPIDLAGILPGVDRIWWRGEVTGPAAIAANWVRVREQ